MAVHPSIDAPLRALDHAGVRWCLLRGEDELHVAPDEVDLLVARADLPALQAALTDAGGFARMPAWGRGPHRFYLTHDADRDAWIKLDVVVALAFGRHHELRTATADAVLERRRRVGTLALPAPADAFWALALHALLDRPGSMRPDHARRLAELAPLARGHDSPLAGVVARACPPGWTPAQIVDAAAARRWDELRALGPWLAEQWPGSGRARRTARVAVSRVQRRLGRRIGSLPTRKTVGGRS